MQDITPSCHDQFDDIAIPDLVRIIKNTTDYFSIDQPGKIMHIFAIVKT